MTRDERHAPRFILRRTTPEQQRRGGQFELALAAAPDRPFVVASFSARSSRRPTHFVFEALEPIPGAKLMEHDSPPGEVARFRYRITASDIRLEGIES